MAERPPQTVHDYPGLFYHQVSAPELLTAMDMLRGEYLSLARLILRACPQTRERSLAMTALEESLLRAIQSLAIVDPSAKQTPSGFEG